MELDLIRKNIDKIDSLIINLFEKRMSLIKKVAEYKKNKKISIIDNFREKQIFNLNIKKLKNKEYNVYAYSFLEELLSLSKKYQFDVISKNKLDWKDVLGKLPCSKKKKNPKVAYSGIEGSFGETAALKYFKKCNLYSCQTFEETIKMLLKNKVDYSILPIENTSSGAIFETITLLQKYPVYITGEIAIEAEQCLLGLGEIEDLEIIYSHDQGFIQCAEYLKNKNWQKIPYFNTAISAKKIKKEKNKKIGAIASERAAEIYNLKILDKNINHNKKNFTRFIILKKSIELKKSNNKISIEVILKDKKGSLFFIIKTIKENNLNMTKIESKPILGKPWEYIFFIDFLGNIEDYNVKITFKEIKAYSTKFYFKGNYTENKQV